MEGRWEHMDNRRPGVRWRVSDDRGFTLIEVMVTMLLSVLVGTTALVGLQSFGRTQDRQGTADEVVSILRTTAQRSLSEGRTYCVALDEGASSWSVWRKDCTTGTRVDTGGKARGDAELDAVAFSTPASGGGCPTTGHCVYFFPRGTATPGSLQVAWNGSNDISVTVEGLSSRVSRS